ncbi:MULTISPECIES: glutathione S-transferase family protein [Aliiglaciecola]|uniref:glutathione S-transferase family protein n=1 Tax=Aliiglaciecola TaxID=1406885 RepID=UPI001C09AA4B|nr:MULTISPECIES: glutathione S-transferase family protein [Aliiglaciecola]MBU2879511.1 glutathione S-transferase family protein [Aliiglaciecola lipolytica]MDO6712568.1 glutathione S-transferase family protein [Aliiglaciecola sp. 2_MG-2023]MDO6753688.1 glutathione S-transferase family protein [Aliiglaciecola sp. 1_MG-2023]
MKIYDTHTAPTPRRVRIFLAEKGIDMEYVQVDLAKGENISPEMRLKNPIGKVPILELDDGTCIGESVAICRYFEALQPEPALMGTTPLQQAQIEMWQRQVEFALFMQVGMCFQHTTGYFKDRMTPVPEYGEVAGISASKYLNVLEKRLGQSEYVAGDTFSIADITAMCAIDFARVVKIKLKDEQVNLQRWYDSVSARPSASA